VNGTISGNYGNISGNRPFPWKFPELFHGTKYMEMNGNFHGNEWKFSWK
jgi:hypothetical protein